MLIIPTEALLPFLYAGFSILVLGSIYLIVEAVRVHRLFADSIIGKLVKTLVVVVIIELYSLGVVSSDVCSSDLGHLYAIAYCRAVDFMRNLFCIRCQICSYRGGYTYT